MTKKIVFYTNNIGDGGAQRVLVNLANNFAEDGNDCVFVSSFDGEKHYKLNEKVKYVPLFENRIKIFFIRNYKLTTCLRSLLKKERPDVILSFMPENNFRAIKASRGLDIRTVVSERCDPKHVYKNVVKRFIAFYLYKKADGIVFQTEEARCFFPMKIREKSKVIFNQVAEAFFKVKREGERKDVVSVGRLSAQKNFKLLINSFKGILDKVPDNLVIYGKGEDRDELEGVIESLELKDRVTLAGNVDNIQEKIKSAKAFVMSSDFEGVPNALMEAMTLGIPCVSTDCSGGGARALITDKEDGIIVPIGDEKALADAMLKVLTDGEFAERLGKNAKEKAKSLFAPDVVFNEWKEFLLR